MRRFNKKTADQTNSHHAMKTNLFTKLATLALTAVFAAGTVLAADEESADPPQPGLGR